MNRRIILSGLTLLVVACIFLSLVCLPGAFVFASIKPAAPPEQPALVCPVLKTNPGVKDTIPLEISRGMDEIQKQVIQIRGLCPKAVIPRGILTRSELQKKVETDFFKQYSRQDASDDVQSLAALGLVEPGFDLYGLYLRLYSEQIAGYYDDQAKEMFVINDTNFGGPERMTYSHEYTHTLQDQTYDLRGKLKLNDEYCKTNSERCSAISALIEGDATMTEQEWFSKDGSEADKKQVQEFVLTFKSPVLDDSPEFLKEDFLFPYREGYELVQTIFDQGGWQAVDGMYANPPLSTEQVLHPARYPYDKPVDVTLPDLGGVLGNGWRKLDQEVLGEWYIFLTLAYGKNTKANLPLPQARQASSGWGGDQYATYLQDGSNKVLFLYRSNWDTPGDADEFWKALQDYGKARWGIPQESKSQFLHWRTVQEGQVIFSRDNQDMLWIMAPTPDLVDQILGLIPAFQP